jgi:hypothetical protein
MRRRAVLIAWLAAGLAMGSCGAGDPTPVEAAAAALGTALAKSPADFAACVAFDDNAAAIDFPRTVTDALAAKRPNLRAVSACFVDRSKGVHRIARNGDPVPLVACGAARRLKPSRDPHTVRIECGIYHGASLNAVGWGFDVRRTFWGSLMVTDLGQAWVS